MYNKAAHTGIASPYRIHPRIQALAWAWISTCVFSTAVLAAGNTNEQTLQSRSLAATCAGCHGTGGNAVSNSAVASLSQMSSTQIMTKMQAYKQGELPATVMHQLAKGYTDEQIATIANYLGKQ